MTSNFMFVKNIKAYFNLFFFCWTQTNDITSIVSIHINTIFFLSPFNVNFFLSFFFLLIDFVPKLVQRRDIKTNSIFFCIKPLASQETQFFLSTSLYENFYETNFYNISNTRWFEKKNCSLSSTIGCWLYTHTDYPVVYTYIQKINSFALLSNNSLFIHTCGTYIHKKAKQKKKLFFCVNFLFSRAQNKFFLLFMCVCWFLRKFSIVQQCIVHKSTKDTKIGWVK